MNSNYELFNKYSTYPYKCIVRKNNRHNERFVPSTSIQWSKDFDDIKDRFVDMHSITADCDGISTINVGWNTLMKDDELSIDHYHTKFKSRPVPLIGDKQFYPEPSQESTVTRGSISDSDRKNEWDSDEINEYWERHIKKAFGGFFDRFLNFKSLVDGDNDLIGIDKEETMQSCSFVNFLFSTTNKNKNAVESFGIVFDNTYNEENKYQYMDLCTNSNEWHDVSSIGTASRDFNFLYFGRFSKGEKIKEEKYLSS